MKKFLKSIFLFNVPIVFFLFIILFLDPLNYFNYFNYFDDSKSKNYDYIITHINDTKKKNKEILIFGDSRMDLLNPEIFQNKTKLTSSNFSIGGANFDEIYSMFWHIIKNNNRAKRIYIGLNSNLLTTNSFNRVDEKLLLTKNPIIFLISKSNLKASFYLLKNILYKNKFDLETPNFNFDDFWNYQLSSSAKNFFRTFNYNKSIEKKLLTINDYCIKNSIELNIVFPPTHIDLQNLASEFDIKIYQDNLIRNLKVKGLNVINLDKPNEFTSNKNNFNDPFHFKQNLSSYVIDQIINYNIKM
tara:strand:- start:896 stop:1798 length:903 start_codon:yes stop_codon:yes gene_type:complete